MVLCKSAGLVGRDGQFYVESYPNALAKLQRAHQERADHLRKANFVEPFDW